MTREEYVMIAAMLYEGAIYRKLEGDELVKFCRDYMVEQRSSFSGERFDKCIEQIRTDQHGKRGA